MIDEVGLDAPAIARTRLKTIVQGEPGIGSLVLARTKPDTVPAGMGDRHP